MYRKEESVQEADDDNTQSGTSCLCRRMVDSNSVEIRDRGRAFGLLMPGGSGRLGSCT